MRLFDTGPRTELRPKKESEPSFDYYNQSARPTINVLREILECWFERFPDEEHKSLRERFRSPRESNHQGAFFELYVHELFTCLGFELRAHPSIQGQRAHPDFIGCSRSGDRFYLEATVAGLPSQQEQGAKARMAAVYDAINTIESPNFFLKLDIRGAPATAPPTGKLRHDLTGWLASLNPDEIAQLYGDNKRYDVPSFAWHHEGWDLLFTPIPKSPELRGQLGVRPIGLRSPGGGWLATDADIRQAIEVKAKKFRDLVKPLIVAVNFIGVHCDNIDVMNALYGQESTIVTFAPDGGFTERNQRKPNGAWFGPSGPRNTVVSGLLLANQLNPLSMGITAPELFHNPWAAYPLSPSVLCLPQCVADLDVGYVRHESGRHAGEVLSIPSPWPLPDE